MKTEILEEGKLPPEILASFLNCTSKNPRILVEAAVGEDAAIVKGAERLVVTADPVTFTEENIGTYTVAINCNDVVAMGGQPEYLTTTILVPPGTTRDRLESIFRDLERTAGKAGVLWVGGHTEVTSAVNRIIVSGQAVGSITGSPTTTAAALPGDAIVMTKWAGLEGSTLIARTYATRARRLLGKSAYREVCGWLEKPGISIIEEGRILKNMKINAAHDPTEGGIATGINEIVTRSGVGAEIDWERIAIREETAILCREFGLNPLGLLSSGVFLFTAGQANAAKACTLLAGEGIAAGIIGRITNSRGRIVLNKDSEILPFPVFVKDEFLKIQDSQ